MILLEEVQEGLKLGRMNQAQDLNRLRMSKGLVRMMVKRIGKGSAGCHNVSQTFQIKHLGLVQPLLTLV